MEIRDLVTDFSDGIRLLKLVELVSNKKIGKPNQGKFKIHKIENINVALSFLEAEVGF